MDLKSFINEKSDLFDETLTPNAVAAFKLAIGGPPENGLENTSENVDVPPTFLTRFRKGEFALFEKMQLPLSSVLHGEQEYQYLAPMRSGMTISYHTRLTDFHEKKGSSFVLQFLIFQTDFHEKSKSDLLATSRTTIIVRRKL